MMKSMRKISLFLVALIVSLAACNTSQKGTDAKEVITEDTWRKMKTENVTVQEWISGVEGGTNTIEFKLDIHTGSALVQPDSLHFQGYHCAIFLRNEAEQTYSGKTKKIRGSSFSPNSELKISFKGHKEQISVLSDQIEILSPVHMP